MSTDTRSQLLHGALTERIIRAFYAVYNELGNGFLEAVYERALALELEADGLRADRQAAVPVYYRGQVVGEYFADLIVDDAVILELKAGERLDRAHEAQLLHYLRATTMEVGLLMNFGPKPEFRRLVYDNERKNIRVSSAEIRGQ